MKIAQDVRDVVMVVVLGLFLAFASMDKVEASEVITLELSTGGGYTVEEIFNYIHLGACYTLYKDYDKKIEQAFIQSVSSPNINKIDAANANKVQKYIHQLSYYNDYLPQYCTKLSSQL